MEAAERTNVKDFLTRYALLEDQITRKVQKVAEMRQSLSSISVQIDEVGCGTRSRNLHAMESTICGYVEMEQQISALIAERNALKNEILRMIDKLPDASHKEVMRRRYIEGEIWEWIALAMGKTKRHILRLHQESITILEQMF